MKQGTKNTFKSLLFAGAFTLTILSSIALFNYKVDPMCMYQCEKINLEKKTRNYFYKVAQIIFTFKDAEVIVLGSSRGQTIPIKWIEEKTGQKTINLSMNGEELIAKTVFLNMSLRNLKLKRVIWFADYFELIPVTLDTKIKTTPAFKDYLQDSFTQPTYKEAINKYLKLIDHNMFEAAYYSYKNAASYTINQGSGYGLNYKKCENAEFEGFLTPLQLEKQIGITYDNYTRQIFNHKQTEKSWEGFVQKLTELNNKEIQTDVVLIPYNPNFLKRLKKEYPLIYTEHQKWMNRIKNLNLPFVKTVDVFESLPGDNGSPQYWTDGIHFTCKGALNILKSFIQN
jgi:hypothetical protein